jgi:SAM-dependent methyltransferase
MSSNPRYIPALRFRWLTRLYDPVVRLSTREREFKRLLIEAIPMGSRRILDVGCGTGTLAILLKEHFPNAEVVGLDGDPQVLDIARRKLRAARVDVALMEGMAQELPFDSESFDRAVSSLVFHHMTTDVKRRALAAIHRVLEPGGTFVLADWGRPHNVGMRLAFLGVQLLDGFETTGDNVRGALPDLMREAGFEDVSEVHRVMTILGTVSIYRGRKPSPHTAA